MLAYKCTCPLQAALEPQKPEEILESTTTSEDWQLELERVLPQLKVTIKTGTFHIK